MEHEARKAVSAHNDFEGMIIRKTYPAQGHGLLKGSKKPFCLDEVTRKVSDDEIASAIHTAGVQVERFP